VLIHSPGGFGGADSVVLYLDHALDNTIKVGALNTFALRILQHALPAGWSVHSAHTRPSTPTHLQGAHAHGDYKCQTIM
jgi:hypothetical protein